VLVLVLVPVTYIGMVPMALVALLNR
jgi:hypothetical protein